jgi:prepilin-type N-terminal cleavage/methylation domain-containing protein
MNAQKGFTLLEMLVLAAVIVILVTAALPNFGATIKSNRGLSNVGTLAAASALARNTADLTGRDVLVCAGAGGHDCAHGTWSAGYAVEYVTLPLPTAALIPYIFGSGHGTTLVSSISDRIVFHASGVTELPGTTTFTLCDSRGARDARALDLLVSSVTEASTTLGRDANGEPLACS